MNRAARILPRFFRAEHGVSAVEFALLAPICLMIMAAALDIGGLLHIKYRLNAAISAGANYALVNGQEINSAEDGTLAMNIVKVLASDRPLSWSDTEVVVNNGARTSVTGGIAVTTSQPGNADKCYCPTREDGEVAWRSEMVCGAPCPGGGAAGKFVAITASQPYSPMFGGYGFLDKGLISVTAVVQAQ